MVWIYFTIGNGKGEVDGISVLLKREVWKEQIKPIGLKIQNVAKMVAYLKIESKEYHATSSKVGQHINKYFHEMKVGDVDRSSPFEYEIVHGSKSMHWVWCRNPSFGLATKAKRLQRCGPRRSPWVTSETPGSVGECEGVSHHTRKATPTLGDGVPVDSQNFRDQFEGSKLDGL